MNLLTMAAKFVHRDIRAGELWLLMISLILAVTCVSSIHLFTDRIERALKIQAATLLGGDVVFLSNQPISEMIPNKARELNLTTTKTTTFYSMVASKENLVLAEVKAVSLPYPLRGELKISDAELVQGAATRMLPMAGEVWIQARLLKQLGLRLNDAVKIGRAEFIIKKILVYEPDSVGSWFTIAPRILMNQQDVERTGVIQPGSRIEYRLLLTGQEERLNRFSDQIKSSLQPGQKLVNSNTDRSNLANILDKTQDYLNISGVIAVILAGISIALSSQRYCQRHQNTVAIMRCFGASMPKIMMIFLLSLFMISLFSIMLGLSLGLLLQNLLEIVFSGLINFQLPPTKLMASLPAIYVGLLLLAGFSYPQLIRLKNVSAAQILKRSQIKLPRQNALLHFSAIVSVMTILFWQAHSVKLVLILSLSLLFSATIMIISANGLLLLLQKNQNAFEGGWRMGVINVIRHRTNSILNVAAFGVIFLILLLLTLLYTNLTVSWKSDLPKRTPNFFAINISPDNTQELVKFLTENNIHSESLYPMVRGRLTMINQKPISDVLNPQQENDESTKRDLNLTYLKNLPPGNIIVQGQWWDDNSKALLVSVEEGFANRLGLKLGQMIGLNVSGQVVSAQIVNIRRVSWGSFKPNFFLIFTPGVLDQLPATYMTSFYLSNSETPLLISLNKQFPDVTLIDVADIIAKVQSIITNMTIVIFYVLFFMFSIAFLVLVTSIRVNIKQRSHDSAIMRAQGAQSWQIRQMLLMEFVTLGALAGFCAGVTSVLCCWILSLGWLAFPIHISLWPIWITPLVSGLLIGCVGYFTSLPTLRASPMMLLKTF